MINFNSNRFILSQTGKGALQLPLGKHMSSDAPINEFPLAQESCTRILIFVSLVFIVSPRRLGISGQFTACNIQIYYWQLSELLNLKNLHNNINGMLMSSRCLACKYSRIIFDCMNDTQSVFQCCVSCIVCNPAFWVNSIFMTDNPFRVSESTHPQTFHVYRSSRINN